MEIPILDQVKEVLGDMHYQETSKQNSEEITYQVPEFEDAKRVLIVEHQRNLVVIYSWNAQFRVEDAKKNDFLIFIAKANEVLSFGNIEMNIDTGVIRYKTSQAFPKFTNARQVIQYMKELHEKTFPKINEAAVQLNEGGTDPREMASILRAI